MNKIRKGNKIEHEFKYFLIKNGFVVDSKIRPRFPRQTNPNDYSLTTDLWGCFDVIALHPNCPLTLYFQVSTDWKFGEQRRQIEEFKEKYLPEDIVFMVKQRKAHRFEFMWYSGKGVWKRQSQKEFLLSYTSDFTPLTGT